MAPDLGTVIVLLAVLSDCPGASVYGPFTTAADCKMHLAAEVSVVTLLEPKVTEPLRANSLPSTPAPVVTVIEVDARMFPLKLEVVPRVAELPTCQRMLAAFAP